MININFSLDHSEHHNNYYFIRTYFTVQLANICLVTSLAPNVCSTVVSYFTGTFQDKDVNTWRFDAQFQVRLNADKKDRRIYLLIDGWNQSVSSISDFGMGFDYDNGYPM